MLVTDAVKGGLEIENSVFNHINNINVQVIAEVQKDLTQYDITSLVFLLYDVPDTALQRLTLLQRVSKDIDGRGLNLLYDWAVHAQARPLWKYEFLEALAVCQLYGVIRKLGFHVPSVKGHYKPVHLSNYINPMKKVLYRICEDLSSSNLIKLKKALTTYDLDVNEFEACELIFLVLLSRKFILLESQYEPSLSMNYSNKCNIEKLALIIENLPGLALTAANMREVENKINKKLTNTKSHLNHSTPKVKQDPPQTKNEMFEDDGNEIFAEDFNDTFDILANLIEENLSFKNLKSDASQHILDGYEIKNKNRVGVCYIINQDSFYPSSDSIETHSLHTALPDREGSSKDKRLLETTMKDLNFHVETSDNLTHQEVLPKIKEVIQYKFKDEDSIFMLCILSHGIEGHVYGADSVAVKVNDIEQLLDSEDAIKLRQKPKVLIIQACQVRQDKEPLKLIADGPDKSVKFFLPKSDFLIYWATAPEYEAYRVGRHGSVFIQCLCYIIQQNAKIKHLFDMCTKTTHYVSDFVAKLEMAQVPIFHSTLRKNLYLGIPEA